MNALVFTVVIKMLTVMIMFILFMRTQSLADQEEVNQWVLDFQLIITWKQKFVQIVTVAALRRSFCYRACLLMVIIILLQIRLNYPILISPEGLLFLIRN